MNAQEMLAKVEVSDVLKVFSGRHACMCGCQGKYYTNDVDAEIEHRQVTRILNLLKGKFAPEVQVQKGLDDEIIFFTNPKTTTKNYTIYVKKGVL